MHILALTGGRVENDAKGSSEAGTWFWNLRFAVKGRSDFSLGLRLGMAYFDRAGEGDQSDWLKVFDTAIDMRYYY